MSIWKHWCKNCGTRIGEYDGGFCRGVVCRQTNGLPDEAKAKPFIGSDFRDWRARAFKAEKELTEALSDITYLRRRYEEVVGSPVLNVAVLLESNRAAVTAKELTGTTS